MSPEISSATSVLDVRQLKGWLPVDAVIREGRPGLLWLDMRGVSFTEPFFADTVTRRMRELPSQSELFTDLESLLLFEKSYKLVPPKGLIFHSSRCGSTAVANALKAIDQTVVFSEPYVVDKLISRFFTDARDDHTKQLLYSVFIRAAVGILGLHCGDADYFVKLSALSGLQLRHLQKLWPDVPWIFIYRDPLEIMVSNLRDPPEWLNHRADIRMAAALLELDENEVGKMSTEEFCARLLGRLFRVAGDNLTSKSRLLNYRELSPQTLVDIIRFFVDRGGNIRQAVEVSLAVYAKDKTGTRPFVPDSNEKQKAATREVQVASGTWAREAFERLESLRKEQQAIERYQ